MLTEFDTDQAAVSTLLDYAARGYGFGHAAQRLRDNRAEQTVLAAAADRLREQGVTVVEQPEYRDDTTKGAAGTPHRRRPAPRPRPARRRLPRTAT